MLSVLRLSDMLVCVTPFAIQCRSHKPHVVIPIEIVCRDLVGDSSSWNQYPATSHGSGKSLSSRLSSRPTRRSNVGSRWIRAQSDVFSRLTAVWLTFFVWTVKHRGGCPSKQYHRQFNSNKNSMHGIQSGWKIWRGFLSLYIALDWSIWPLW